MIQEASDAHARDELARTLEQTARLYRAAGCFDSANESAEHAIQVRQRGYYSPLRGTVFGIHECVAFAKRRRERSE